VSITLKNQNIGISDIPENYGPEGTSHSNLEHTEYSKLIPQSSILNLSLLLCLFTAVVPTYTTLFQIKHE
jgi:hypothetical protein